jgi:hypothetical protein
MPIRPEHVFLSDLTPAPRLRLGQRILLNQHLLRHVPGPRDLADHGKGEGTVTRQYFGCP